MTLLDGLGHPVDDRGPEPPQELSRCRAPSPEEELALSPAPKRRRRPLVVIASCIAVCVAAAVVGWPAIATIAPERTATDATPPGPLGVAGTAELFASLYLAGTSREAIARVYAGEPPPPSGAWISQTAAVAVNQVDRNRWEVTVAVDSLANIDGSFQPVPLEFYLVPMAVEGDRAIAVGAPARVPAPFLPEVAITTDGSVIEEKAVIAGRFIELYLRGDPAAFGLLTSPTAVPEFAVPPYGTVATDVVGTDSLGRVIVAARAITANEITHALEYLVTLEAGKFGWRVGAIASAVR